MIHRRLLALTSLSLLSALDPLGVRSAAAQSAPSEWSHRVLDLPSGLVGGPSLGEVVSGDFGGAALRSTVFLRGDAPVFALAPHIAHCFVEVEPGAPSIQHLAPWPDGIAPGHDAVLGVGPAGLARFHYDPRLGLFQHAAVPTSAAWNGARSLATRDLDLDGDVEAYGVSNDGGWLLVLEGTGTGFGAETAHALPFPGLQAVALDFEPEFGMETAVLTIAGLCVLNAAGQVLWMVAETGPPGRIEAVRNEVGAGCIAWTRWDAGQGAWVLYRYVAAQQYDLALPLFVTPPGGQQPVSLDAVVGMTACDWNGDELMDLALAHTGFQSGVVLLQQPTGGYSTAPSATRLIELTSTPAATAPVVSAAFAVADHHVTGNDTVVAAVGAEGLVAATKLTTEEQDQDQVLAGASIFPTWMNSFTQGATRHLWLTFNELPAEWLAKGEVQILSWRQLDPQAALEPVVAYNRVFPIAPPSGEPDGWYLDVELPAMLTGQDNRLGYLQIRFVERDVEGRIVDASRDVIVGYTDDTEDGWADDLAQNSGADIVDLDSCQHTPPAHCFGNGEVGGVIPQHEVPPPPPGVSMIYGTPTERSETLTPFSNP